MKALVVVCYQNDMVKGPMGHTYARMIENNICDRIESVLRSKGDLFFVMNSFEDDYERSAEGIRNPIRHCIRGSQGAKLYGRLNDYAAVGRIVRKDSPGSEDLLTALKHYDEIELCGVDTVKDVLPNAIMARTANPYARVVVMQNCVAAKDSMLAEEAMDILVAVGVNVL